jgi:hypothetical protein
MLIHLIVNVDSSAINPDLSTIKADSSTLRSLLGLNTHFEFLM